MSKLTEDIQFRIPKEVINKKIAETIETQINALVNGYSNIITNEINRGVQENLGIIRQVVSECMTDIFTDKDIKKMVTSAVLTKMISSGLKLT